jgi:hypothetical protein
MPANKVYSNTKTMAADTADRFETTPVKLKSAYIRVTTQNMVFGDVAAQNFAQLTTDAPMFLQDLDVSKLYFKNAVAGQNGVVNIVGTRY